MDPVVTEEHATTQRVRRRASRAAGPPKDAAVSAPVADDGEVRADDTAVKTKPAPTRPAKKSKSISARPPRRRRPNGRMVGWVSLAASVLVIAGLVWGVVVLAGQHRAADARQAREQRFVDTASQTVVNMYSYTQETIDESVTRFVNGTSGPLRSKFGSENVEFLKQLYRKTNATSEAVINGAALEGIDNVSDNASVLVAVRVTVADIDGVNKPSEPYRLRVIVHQDERGQMTAYDLMYPNGGN
ncbi:mammalian cell entry protein [Mycobacterium paragordonae]|uniref:Mammalian cell entry protein n=1 Tax=Mycobacterium paragordonae TaxID=1389713 RepID=A0A4R5WH25_9MYCO|nr:mammalian cell entry protein [Mycobacterium paragordonae]MDP7738856.1 mammalian cell entry protein [Mycobacterium paragordonae]TDK88768.1 mammalian cell entry protein [Mycobacterium paragordonae]TDK95950.1 mammalian cell entry protein [Mycobacterium paragordonae]